MIQEKSAYFSGFRASCIPKGDGKMAEDTCILCGRAFPTGLHIMGCLICFPCEKRLLSPAGMPRTAARRMLTLYPKRSLQRETM